MSRCVSADTVISMTARADFSLLVVDGVARMKAIKSQHTSVTSYQRTGTHLE